MPACKPNVKLEQVDFAMLVKTALLHKRLTVTALAQQLDLSRNAVSRAINQPTDLPTVKQRVREALELK